MSSRSPIFPVPSGSMLLTSTFRCTRLISPGASMPQNISSRSWVLQHGGRTRHIKVEVVRKTQVHCAPLVIHSGGERNLENAQRKGCAKQDTRHLSNLTSPRPRGSILQNASAKPSPAFSALSTARTRRCSSRLRPGTSSKLSNGPAYQTRPFMEPRNLLTSNISCIKSHTRSGHGKTHGPSEGMPKIQLYRCVK